MLQVITSQLLCLLRGMDTENLFKSACDLLKNTISSLSAHFKGLLHLHLFTSMLIGAYLCVHMCKYMQVLFRFQLGFLNSWGVKTSPHKGESAGIRPNLAQHATSWAWVWLEWNINVISAITNSPVCQSPVPQTTRALWNFTAKQFLQKMEICVCAWSKKVLEGLEKNKDLKFLWREFALKVLVYWFQKDSK